MAESAITQQNATVSQLPAPAANENHNESESQEDVNNSNPFSHNNDRDESHMVEVEEEFSEDSEDGEDDDEDDVRPNPYTDDYSFGPTAGAGVPTTAQGPNIAQSKSAQILMNRFSTWKQKANQNAQTLWNRAKEQRQNQSSLQSELHNQEAEKESEKDSNHINSNSNNSDNNNNSASSIFRAAGFKKPLAFNSLKVDGPVTPVKSTSTATENDSDDNTAGSTNGKDNDSNDNDNETDNDNDNESIPDDPMGSTREKAKERIRKAGVAASSLANVVADSVATGFRGRYTANPNATSATPQKTPTKSNIHGHFPQTPTTPSSRESQTALILKSRVASHMQEILNGLQPHEYVMLLGSGMLGVNLKQCYLKHHGVYVDYLVDGGSAEKAGVVSVGDRLIRVGNVDVRKGTIADVPKIIATSKRPVVLILSTGTRVNIDRVNYIDIAVAMAHNIVLRQQHKERQKEIQQQQSKDENTLQQTSTTGITAESTVVLSTQEYKSASEGTPKQADNEQENLTQQPKLSINIIPGVTLDDKQSGEDALAPIPEVHIPIFDTVDSCVSPPLPPLEARESFLPLIGKRCNDEFQISELTQEIANNSNFRAALQNAFLLCAIDNRKFPFLGRKFSLDSADAMDKSTAQNIDAEIREKSSTPNALLMLFLELLNFADLHGVTPVNRLHDVASRIAYKFFLPTIVGGARQSSSQNVTTPPELAPPMFDFHHIVPDSSLRKLEQALQDTGNTIPRDIFLDFQLAVINKLSGSTFLSYLLSNECARMRASLRNTAPYINVPLRDIIDALGSEESENEQVVHAGAQNYLLYIIIYLITQVEKEPFGENDMLLDDESSRTRVTGVAGGVCCAIFIYRHVLPALKKAQQEKKGTNNEGKLKYMRDVLEVFNHLWEIFVAPGVGALDHLGRSNETDEALSALRLHLRESRRAVIQGTETDGGRQLAFSKKLVDPKVLGNIKLLADQLLYDYACTNHTMFRQHRFHEWMCNEMAKAKAEGKPKSKSNAGIQPKMAQYDPEKRIEDEDSGDSTINPKIPNIAPGCIKRLLRKVHFPVGISAHKAMKETQTDSESSASQQGYPNADCGIIFGTGVGNTLISQMASPAMDQTDIRRYACQDVMLHDNDNDNDDSYELRAMPATLESYTVSPRSRLSPFSKVTGNVCTSTDGWEVSMVNFMIPNADTCSDDNHDSSLYGVSLVFQQNAECCVMPSRKIQTQLVIDDSNNAEELSHNSSTAIEEDNFRSPISFPKPEGSNGSGTESKRNIQIPNNIPSFNQRLQEKPWLDRVLQEEYRDKSAPLTIGIALVSQSNVICAMRQTLWRLLRDYSRLPSDDINDKDGPLTCGALVEILGNFAHQDVEPTSLRCILQPYLRAASSPWLDRPLLDQREEFERMAGQQLIRSLPPIPLALMFVTALVEQKIVLSSSRRSILFSATVALKGMLEPLKWCHLLVPLVPSALARDLLQYPAPFILGMPSEDPGIMELLNNLPKDVTLVDLDVGRVILASSFTHDMDCVRNSTTTMKMAGSALRSQVLYLAQVLGSHFGTRLFKAAWSCDSPLVVGSTDARFAVKSDYEVLRAVCRSFLDELLAGMPSCLYWIEEASNKSSSSNDSIVERTILFDEDQFFLIKNQRERNGFEALLCPPSKPSAQSTGTMTKKERHVLALSLDDFDLVFESLLRCQSMSWYISSELSKQKMAFFL